MLTHIPPFVHNPLIALTAVEALVYLAAAAVVVCGHKPKLVFAIYTMLALTHITAVMADAGFFR
jgi:hypothetical protein